MDLNVIEDADLEQLRIDVLNEQDRRHRIAIAPAAIDALNRDYLAADNQVSGGVWKQPSGAVDAYPEGWQVTEGGKTWESLIPANAYSPTAYRAGWKEVTT